MTPDRVTQRRGRFCDGGRRYGVMTMATPPKPTLIGGRAVLAVVRIGITVPDWKLAT
jgi:hypothetical protein